MRAFLMAVYVFDKERGIMVDKVTREPMNPEPLKGDFPCPRVWSDIEPYLSPVDGRYIGGRRSKRDDLARNNCVDASELPSATGGKFKNKRFAKKWGVESLLKEEAQ
jgi:hypothetical protein